MSDSPVSRTMAALREDGYDPWVVERSVPTRPHPTKIDLFGIVDLEALADDHTLYVQVCRDADLTDHFRKCRQEEIHGRLARLLTIPTRRFEIWSWAKKRDRWRARVYHARLHGGSVTFVELAQVDSRETLMDAAQGADL